VQLGVLAGETDDGELIHVHSFDLLRIDLSPLLSWGTSEQAAPLPSQRSALSGGPAAPNGFLRQGWGSQESRTECSAGRVGLSAAVPRTTEGTGKSTGDRRIRVSPPGSNGRCPSQSLQTARRLRTRTTRRIDLAGFGPAGACVYRSSDEQTPDVGPLTAKGKDR
jgi:hypothetical protein